MKPIATRECNDAVVAAQFKTIARNIPGLYLTVALFAGFLIYFLWDLASPGFFAIWGGVILCGAGARARHWLNLRKRRNRLSVEEKRRELDRTLQVGALMCVWLCAIAVVVARAPSATQQAMAMMLVWSAAVGTSFHLAVLPRAARLVLLTSTLAAASVFLVSGEPVLELSLLALLALAVAILHLLARTYEAFAALVQSSVENASLRREAVDMASTDALTGLPNRRLFDRRLSEWSESDRPFAVAMIDLDGFKPVNDLHGHLVGDLFLAEAANRLAASVGGAGLLARMGGDEFALLVESFEAEADVVDAAHRLVAAVADTFNYGSITAQMSCSCGVALRRQNEDARRLLERADMALYEAKAKARGGVVVFSEALERSALQRMIVAQDLRAAIEREAFAVCYQPIIDLATGELAGFEALARWRHPELGAVPPSVFIPAAEKSGLIAPLSMSLLRQAAHAARNWPSGMTLSFNLSAAQMDQPGTALAILSAIAECGLPPSRLEIELTETAVLADLQTATRTVGSLAAAGIRISLDDFGAGYSSFGQLCDLAIDKVKIDKSFVDRIVAEPRAASIVGAIIRMCDGLGMQCVAEGIETPQQLEALKALGCHKGQGFLLSRPLPESELPGFIWRIERRSA
ncbi:putative bifunctional diguanylate cyclase/phosphodiesterase [Methylocystis sp. JAN1]|uniref:putative bifunctional diguanylate cyclase/phosphodiesterase n=1 Tax=Methylocystis sp. JAN1 TaxID=3397211 RepID=UPI003FA2D0F6